MTPHGRPGRGKCASKTWRRPTLPRLETKYHRRRGFSRPSSEWDRVRAPRHGHQVIETHSPPAMNLGGQIFAGKDFSQPMCRRPPQDIEAVEIKPRNASHRLKPMRGCRASWFILAIDVPEDTGCGRKLLSTRKRSFDCDAIKPIERLGPVSFTCCHASTPGLSTWWSSTALKGESVSRGASHLDAFSGYPVRT